MKYKGFLLKIIEGDLGLIVLPKSPPTPKGEYLSSLFLPKLLPFRAGVAFLSEKGASKKGWFEWTYLLRFSTTSIFRSKPCTKYFFLILSLLSIVPQAYPQNTVGVITNNIEESYPGYNLIYPHNQSNVYLLDNCGQLVHTWQEEDTFRPGNAAYILENGNLIKCKRQFDATVNDRIWAGGGGAIVEVRSWENDLLASYTLNDETVRLHHDIAALPNGNILMIAWELKDSLTSIAAGRNPDLLPQGEVWSEMILEWNPNTDEIVWEWHAWDHLVQDFNDLDIGQFNFGVIAEHPELININYDEHDGHPDWLHINAIDYNPVLDQIVLSVPYFNEFWIIDHSTTTEEAKGHTGGNGGKGGDLLYRWGNPAAYNQGTLSDKKCFFQHDVHWVNPTAESAESDFGVIAFYNNRVGDDFATINSVQTRFDERTQSYLLQENKFEPTDLLSTFVYPDQSDIRAFSNSLSSAQYLPNGNVLALAGRYGFAYELNPDQEVVWSYIVPLRGGSVVTQGDTLTRNNNLTFRMERYPIDYKGFFRRTLEPNGYLELEPNMEFCGMVVSVDEVPSSDDKINVFPNPANQEITIETASEEVQFFTIYSMTGQLMRKFQVAKSTKVSITSLPAGIYLLSNGQGFIEKLMVH